MERIIGGRLLWKDAGFNWMIARLMKLENYELVRLANGAVTVRSREDAETFHPVIGPVAEAEELYVKQTRLAERVAAQRASEEFVIWDIGLGSAGNVLTALRALSHLQRNIRILSFDHTLAPLAFAAKHAEELGYVRGFEHDLRHLLEQGRVERHCLNWEVLVADFPTLLASDAAANWPKPHALFFDAYSPARNPAMWTLPLFRRLFALLDPARPCAMPTYSRSTMLRVTLLLAGFFVGAGAAIADKEETTIAANDLSLIERPLGKDWLRRAERSTCAEPLARGIYTRAPLAPGSLAALKSHPQFA